MIAFASLVASFVSLFPICVPYPSAGSELAAPANGIPLPGRANGLAARVDAHRFLVDVPAQNGGEHAERVLSVATTSFGRVGSAEKVTGGALGLRDSRLELTRSGFVEWFERKPDGVEQGWTIPTPPSRDAGDVDVWIGVTFDGLAPQISEGGHYASLVDERGVHRLSYRGLEAWDAAGRSLPARMDAIGAEFGIRVDDAGAAYPITVDPVLGSYDFFFHPQQAGARMILASSAGDVDGDGYSDLLVSADLWTEGTSDDAGHVWLFRGSANGLVTPAWWESSGPTPGGQPGGQYGSSVATLGDIDADGFDDFAVGAEDWDSLVTGTNAGALFVYRGGSSAPTLHWTIEGSAPSDFLHGPDRYVGDLNGDGRDDLVTIVAGSGTNESVSLYLGSGFATPPSPVATLTKASLGLDAGSNAGFRVGTAGDVDGDGFEDLLVGAPSSFGGQGRAFLFRGGVGGLNSTTPLWIGRPPGTPVVSYYGLHVGSAGDLDGNGYPDVFVAAYGHPGDLTGAVYVYMANPNLHGAQTLPAFDDPSVVVLPGSGAGSRFGIGCDTAGDFDADGFSDLIVGMPPLSGILPGTALIFRGSSSGLIQASTWQQVGPEAPASFGSRTGSIGDVNGDGRTDVFVTAIDYTHAGTILPAEGAIFAYHGRSAGQVVGTISTGQASLAGPPTSGFGTALATGDVNGDGLQDVLVGAPDYTNGQTNEGRVSLYLASPTTGFLAAPAWTFESDVGGARLGASVAVCGDIDNDGFDDVLVGAPNYASGQNDEGRVWLFRGTASGNLGVSPAWTYESDSIGALLGSSVAGAGDVNADGYADLVVGAPGTYLGDALRGSARLFYGRPAAQLSPSFGATLDAGIPGARFGAAVAGVDDLNRDGYSDVVVGSPSYSSGQVDEGRAYAFLGGQNGIATTANWTYESQTTGATFGAVVSPAGDVNRDGLADVVIGAPGWTSGSTQGGAAFLFLAQAGVPSLPANATTTLGETQAGARQGASVTFAGDVNSDGFSDVLVGAPLFDAASATIVDAGRVQLFLGASTGLITPPAWSREGSNGGSRLGAWCAGGADFDGDGFSDLALGVPGDAEIYVNPGSSGQGAYFGSDQRQLSDQRAVRLLGESDATNDFRIQGTSFNSSFIPSTVLGREDYRVEFENKVYASTLNGSNLQHSASFVDSGPVSGGGPPPIRVPVAQPGFPVTSSNAYQWRMRIEHRNPLVPHTRWLPVQGNGVRGKKIGTAPDCNGNGIPDANDLGGNDCDADLVPDECEVPPICPTCLDCNNNSQPDSCDITSGFSTDCDSNLIPDECQVDCDGLNGADACQILQNPSLDTNADGVLDSCQTNVAIFCPGDGTGTACPCGNASMPADAEGCRNSLGTGGRLRSSGVPRVTADNFVLLGTRMPNSSALYFQGTVQQNAGAGSVFGDGKRCAAGSIVRLGTKSNSAGASQYGPPGDVSISIRGLVPFAGATRTYQCWYRNAAAFCTTSTFNLTNGLSATWVP